MRRRLGAHLVAKLFIAHRNLHDVILRFAERRNLTVIIYITFAGVVACKRQNDVAVVAVEQPGQVLQAAARELRNEYVISGGRID